MIVLWLPFLFLLIIVLHRLLPHFSRRFKSSSSASISAFTSSSTTSSTPCKKKHEVFITFRGSDVRAGFLSHLHKALRQHGVDFFLDEELERGGKIANSLLEVIEGSYISVAIFSKNYAYSEWCLDELVKILECMERNGQRVIPVFYGIDPTHVQELTGTYGDAITQHRRRFRGKVDHWCQALRETASLSGLVSSHYKSESELVEDITRYVLEKINHLFSSDSCYDDGLVGIDSRVKNVMSLLYHQDAWIVGIWGLGGIGKTTIARATFDRICSEFESYCFVENIREKSERYVDILQSEILPQLIGAENFRVGNSVMVSLPFIRRKLSTKKFLLVLDDVSDFSQIKFITQKGADFGSGSKIIVTSRDRHLLNYIGAVSYEVEKLDVDESLQLFCFHAFKQNSPRKGYSVLSLRAIDYAQGLPLALEVLGSDFLYGLSVEEWEDELERLKDTSNEKIGTILKTSYERLCDNDKEVFLYIACFFVREDKNRVISILNVAGSRIGISRLCNKCLISISENKLHMHDLIREMAKDITRVEILLRNRSFLWHHKDVCRILTNNEGTEAIKGVLLDMRKIGRIELQPTTFERMHNLKLLKFYTSCGRPDNKRNLFSSWSRYDCTIKVHLPDGITFFPSDLRLLQWVGYPLNFLPSTSFTENLVELRMPQSQLKELWHGAQRLGNLKLIDLSYCNQFIRLPDFSKTPNVELLKLEGCGSLVEIPSSVQYLSKLEELNLSSCLSLYSLPDLQDLKMLENLVLDGCSNVKMIPRLPRCMKYLGLSGTAIEQVPSYIADLCNTESSCKTTNMTSICNGGTFGLMEKLFGIREIEVTDSIHYLKCLAWLDLSDCANLQSLPENIGNLKSLQVLDLEGSSIKELPDSICNLISLTDLNIDDCKNLCRLPENLGKLESLTNLNMSRSGIKQLPSSFHQLQQLTHLRIEKCDGFVFPHLSSKFTCLRKLGLAYNGMTEFPISICSLATLKELSIGGNEFESIPEAISQLHILKELDLSDCKRLLSLPELPCSLIFLWICNCSSLRSAFTTLHRQENLIQLAANNCFSLDQKECSQILDHALELTDIEVTRFPEGHGDQVTEDHPTKWTEIIYHQRTSRKIAVCVPGSEIPARFMYQNKAGSCLSVPFTRLPMKELDLCFCAIVDPKHLHLSDRILVGCLAIFTDESRKSYSDFTCFMSNLDYHCFDDYSDRTIESEHVFIWREKLVFMQSEEGNGDPCTVHFRFCNDFIKSIDEGIVGCGIHLLLNDEDDEIEDS